MSRLSRWVSAAVVATFVLLVASSAAQAGPGVSATQVTTPADGLHLTHGDDDPDSSFVVSGTATGPDGAPVDLYCFARLTDGSVYPGTAGGAAVATTVVSGGSFSATVDQNDLSLSPCVLKAVPAADTGPDLEADATDGAFGGVRIASSARYTGSGTPGDTYAASVSGFAGDPTVRSAGDLALASAYAVAEMGGLPQQSELLFHYAGVLAPINSDPGPPRSQSVVDGRNAYAGTAASYLYTDADAAPGAPGVTFSDYQLDPVTGRTTFTEREALVRCDAAVDPTPYEADATTCPAFLPTGVSLVRTVTVDHEGAQTVLQDRFVSQDGQQHALDLRYEQDVTSDANTTVGRLPTQFAFPWVDGDPSQPSSYHAHADGDVIAGAPAAAATSMYIWPNEGQPTSTSSGGGRTVSYANGSIVTAGAPEQVLFGNPGLWFGSTDDGFELVYHRTVPAGASAFVTHVYSMSFTENGLDALTADAMAVASAPLPVPVLAPSAQDFGAQATGSASAPRTFTVSNPAGSAADLTVTSVQLTGSDATQFGAPDVSGCQAGGSFAPVPPGGQCTLTVAFAPTALGDKTATLAVSTDAGDVQSTLTGSGTAPPVPPGPGPQPEPVPPSTPSFTVAPTSRDFGGVTVGRSADRTFVVRNTGQGSLALAPDAVSITAGSFAIRQDGCAGHTVAPGATCSVKVRFRPTVAGSRSATLRVVDEAHTASLKGAGVGSAQLVSRVVRLSHGVGRLELTCPRAFRAACRVSGAVTVRLPPAGARAAAAGPALPLGGFTSVSVASGGHRTVSFTVPKRSWARLSRQRGRLPAVVTLTTRTANGPAVRSSQAAIAVRPGTPTHSAFTG